jgi:hypothetical protein
LQDRLLHKTVHHRRDAQLAHPATGFGDLHPAHGLRPVADVQQRGNFERIQTSSSVTGIPSTPAAPLFAFTRL